MSCIHSVDPILYVVVVVVVVVVDDDDDDVCNNCFSGAAAFDDWTYRINYCTQESQSICSEESTTSLNITLLGLIPDTSYMLTIAAVGARGSKVTDQYVFTTKNTGESFPPYYCRQG